MKENRRKEIERLWKLCKETNVIVVDSILHICYIRMEDELKRRLNQKVYSKMAIAITCFANHAQDDRFAKILLHKLERYIAEKNF